ncbi:MAG: LPS assembly protein LptD [Holosporales bacterium]|jgi:LPS-assembly protein|nr:LPS assembly protein LptD [Holosporales bacterium]
MKKKALALIIIPLVVSVAFATSKQHDEIVLLGAEEVINDKEAGTITVIGGVKIASSGRAIMADKVIYNRMTNKIFAIGNVVIRDETGVYHYSEYAELSGDLKRGIAREPKMVLLDRSRLAARRIKYRDAHGYDLGWGVYSPCATCKTDPDRPLVWDVRAPHMYYDTEDETVSYYHAHLNLFGMPIFYTPYFSHPSPRVKRRSGFLGPKVAFSQAAGLAVIPRYLVSISPSQEGILQPAFTTKGGKIFWATYGYRFYQGYLNLDGSWTGKNKTGIKDINNNKDASWRGHLNADLKADLTEHWRGGLNGKFLSEKSYFAQYPFLGTQSTMLLSNKGELEGFYGRNYALVQVHTFQTMRLGETASTVPLVLPQIEWNGTADSEMLGGTWTADIFLINLDYPNGKKNRRAFVNAGWKRHFIAPFGQVLTLNIGVLSRFYELLEKNARKSAYETSRRTRVVPEGSLYWRWPWMFTGPSQNILVLEPLLGLVCNTVMSKEDQNFFQKVESGTLFQEITEWNFWRPYRAPRGCSNESGGRFVYGLGGRLYVGGSLLARGTIGQSYMLTRSRLSLPTESGLKERRSHIVGSMELFLGGASLTMRGRYNAQAHRFTSLESKLSFVTAGVSTTLKVFDIDQYNANVAYRKVKGGTVSLSGPFPHLSTWSWSGSGTVAGDKLRLLNRSIGVAYKGDVFSWTNTVAHTFQENYVKRYITTTYQDECFTMTFQAAQVFDDRFIKPKTHQKDTQFTVIVNFKNLGEINSSRLESWIDGLEQSRNT